MYKVADTPFHIQGGDAMFILLIYKNFFFCQLLPHFVMDLISHLHGLPGLYVASLFAAAMR